MLQLSQGNIKDTYYGSTEPHYHHHQILITCCVLQIKPEPIPHRARSQSQAALETRVNAMQKLGEKRAKSYRSKSCAN